MISTDGKELVNKINDENKKPMMKSVVFVPLDGLRQSKKDRLMNNRTVRRPPKNIDLVEEDLVGEVDLQTEVKIKSFPTERKLSSKIKKANSGIDYSNHSIEEHYNRSSVVQKTCKSDTTTSSVQIKKKASLNCFGLVHIAKKKKALQSDAEDKKEAKPRQHYIREGLNDEKFQFVPKPVAGPPAPKVKTNVPNRHYKLVNY